MLNSALIIKLGARYYLNQYWELYKHICVMGQPNLVTYDIIQQTPKTDSYPAFVCVEMLQSGVLQVLFVFL